jgi:uncharacterized membrane protein YfcA
MAPLLVELGVHPSCAAATSGLMVLFSSTNAVAAFAAAHRLDAVHAAMFGSICMVAACAGTFLIGKWVRRSGMASSLVLLLAAIIAVGAVATIVSSGRQAVREMLGPVDASAMVFCN